MIPRTIHQTWKDHDIPERFRAPQDSWKAAHPGWRYRFWTDEDLDELVRTRAPAEYPLYRAYPNHIQRVDAARYVILREFGGIYVDLDVHCRKPFDDLLDNEVVLARTRPWGLTNQLMMSMPNHRFFRRAVKELPRAFHRWNRRWIPRHFRVLATTGPLFVTARYRAIRSNQGVRIMNLEEHGLARADRGYVRHVRGDTWAKWDTHVFKFCYHHWEWLAAGAAASALLIE